MLGFVLRLNVILMAQLTQAQMAITLYEHALCECVKVTV